MRSRSIAVLFVFLASILCCSAFGQTFRGSIQGTVTDPSGAAVAGAKVKIFSPGTGMTRTATTNGSGEYSGSELPLGTYNLTVEKEGFRTTTLTQIPVTVGAPARADVKLAAGEVKELIEVTAEVPLVETGSNTTGGTIAATEAAELPVNGRDFTKLLELVPGTTSDPVGSTESAGSYGLFSLNGNRGRSNNYLLDGTDMNDGYRNLPAINEAGVWGCPATILPVDALAEIPVTGNPEAEFGRSSGATVNIVTKSGTNQIHGSFFEQYRSAGLGARNYFNTTDQEKNSFTNHQFGASAGGALVKDKSFWFLAYEGQREDGALPQVATRPSTNDLAASIDNIGGPGSVNPVIAKLMATNPWGTLNSSENVTYQTPFYNNSNNLIAKVDQHLHLVSKDDLFTARYFYSHGTQLFPLGMLNTGAAAPNSNTVTPTHVNVVSLSYTMVPTSKLIVEVRGGYNRLLQQFLPQDLGLNTANSYGLVNLPTGDTNRYDTGLPTITVKTGNSQFAVLGAGSSDSRGRVDSNAQLFTNVTYQSGHHNYKAGAEWRHTFIDSFINGSHRGTLSFASLDDFLLGNIDGGSSAAGDSTRYTSQASVGAYVQDSWRANNHVTVNYGVRWDYFGVIAEQNHNFSLLDYKSQQLQTVGAAGGPNKLYPSDWLDFSPRISVVDDLYGNGKVVVRTGIGMYYDGASHDFFVGNQPWNTLPAQAGPAFNYIEFAGSTTGKIQSGMPIFGDYGTTGSAFTVSQKNVTPRYVSYNFNIESQLTKKIAAQVGYVGSQGRHLFQLADLNQVNVDSTAKTCADGSKVQPGSTCFSNWVYVNSVQTSAISNYNSLQATLKMQGWHGLTSTLNYTWAHSIDTGSDGLDFVPDSSMPDDNFNPRRDRASSNFDIRHRVQWYFSYAVPSLSKAKRLTTGWTVDGTFNFATGQPFTPTFLYEDDYNGTGEWYGRPDIIGNPHAGASGKNLVNLASFAVPCTLNDATDLYSGCQPGTQHLGNEGRNQFRASNYTNFDFSLAKNTKIGEKLTVQLRADVFNLFNHSNFTNPLLPNFSLDIFNVNGAHASGTRTVAGANPASSGPQFLQPTATPDVGSGNPFLGGGGPRGAQLSAHFNF